MELMKCGHIANAINGLGNPVCVICNCSDIETEKPSLRGRIAECSYCDKKQNSSWDLPFFEYRKDKTTDKYYCGCRGWD